jgi:hypothetical protein
MLPFTLTGVVVGFLVTWVLGLAPAFIARRKSRGPLSRATANKIAATSCLCFGVLFFFIKVALGVPHPRFSPAWILVFFVARWIMVRPPSHREAELLTAAPSQEMSSVQRRPLTRQQIVAKLEEIVGHPTTSHEHREWARSRLKAFNGGSEKTGGRKVRGRFLRDVLPRLERGRARKTAYVVVAFLAADLLIAGSGIRLLVREKLVQPGEVYEARDWGDLGSYGKPVLACWYWTGRSLIPEAFWYGHGKDDRDECSAFHKHKPGE